MSHVQTQTDSGLLPALAAAQYEVLRCLISILLSRRAIIYGCHLEGPSYWYFIGVYLVILVHNSSWYTGVVLPWEYYTSYLTHHVSRHASQRFRTASSRDLVLPKHHHTEEQHRSLVGIRCHLDMKVRCLDTA